MHESPQFACGIAVPPFHFNKYITTTFKLEMQSAFAVQRGRFNIGYGDVRPDEDLRDARFTDLSLIWLDSSVTARA